MCVLQRKCIYKNRPRCLFFNFYQKPAQIAPLHVFTSRLCYFQRTSCLLITRARFAANKPIKQPKRARLFSIVRMSCQSFDGFPFELTSIRLYGMNYRSCVTQSSLLWTRDFLIYATESCVARAHICGIAALLRPSVADWRGLIAW